MGTGVASSWPSLPMTVTRLRRAARKSSAGAAAREIGGPSPVETGGNPDARWSEAIERRLLARSTRDSSRVTIQAKACGTDHQRSVRDWPAAGMELSPTAPPHRHDVQRQSP